MRGLDTTAEYRPYHCSGGQAPLAQCGSVLDEVWITGRPGKLFAGLGYRHLNPVTAYGTLGLFFDAPGRTVVGFKILVGKGYVSLGLLWGFDLRHVF